MTTNVVNQVAYLRTTREFPDDDPHQLAVEANKAYLDTANAINVRTIGIFPVKRPALNGESWFLTSQRQQGFRQVYQIDGTGSFPHFIREYDSVIFTKIYGTFTDGTFWYTLPWVSVVAANNQINIFLNSTDIVITGGGGAQQPVIQSGTVVLEWISRT